MVQDGQACAVSRKGNCWDSTPTESWFGGFKNERVYGERFETRDEVIAMTFEYIEVFYNRKRLHSTLEYKSPMLFLCDGSSLSNRKTGSMKHCLEDEKPGEGQRRTGTYF